MKTIITMIDNISSIKSALVSVVSAFFGTAMNFLNEVNAIEGVTIDNILQRGAWTVAMIAGIVSVINVIKKWLAKPVKKQEDEKK